MWNKCFLLHQLGKFVESMSLGKRYTIENFAAIWDPDLIDDRYLCIKYTPRPTSFVAHSSASMQRRGRTQNGYIFTIEKDFSDRCRWKIEKSTARTGGYGYSSHIIYTEIDGSERRSAYRVYLGVQTMQRKHLARMQDDPDFLQALSLEGFHKSSSRNAQWHLQDQTSSLPTIKQRWREKTEHLRDLIDFEVGSSIFSSSTFWVRVLSIGTLLQIIILLWRSWKRKETELQQSLIEEEL